MKVRCGPEGVTLEATEREIEDLGLTLFDLADRNRTHGGAGPLADLAVRILSALQMWRRHA